MAEVFGIADEFGALNFNRKELSGIPTRLNASLLYLANVPVLEFHPY